MRPARAWGGRGGLYCAGRRCRPHGVRGWRGDSHVCGGRRAAPTARAGAPARCQVKGGRATYDGYWHTWWIKTPAVGMVPSLYMSEIFLTGGGNDEPDTGLPIC
ncbi:hypothetical protein ACF08N_34910 [Streptomyces sp. NPDC015127]|uniref:hypothetical protein n=1 Tax=Streptomyces sp. NPDC015127 TaxID=3364939 RepID=UPI0037003D7A